MSSDMIDRLNAALEGRYRIERELGEGGMATVYLAEDIRHRRSVAVKVLRPELAAVVGAERFLAEIETTAALQHPHILPLFDSGEADGFLFYVMPYVEGESLRERLDEERQLPVDEAVELARKVADALQYAHEQGVIHRDVKPANILLSRGNPLVADFGIALAVSQAGGGRITETGLSLGTPHYMSPEQASGERTVDRRSDIYALGCVLYEMLAGEPPHGGPTSQAVLARILTADPQRVSQLRRAVPAHVDAVVARALEKLPADRFATAEELRAALADPSFRHAAAPIPVGIGGRGGGGSGSRWPGPGVVLGAAGLVILALLFLAFGDDGARSEAEFGIRPTVRFSLDLGESSVSRTEMDLSPDGRMLVYAPEGGGPLHLRLMNELDARPVPGTDGGQWPVFSPDGQWIAYMVEDGIRKVPVAGGSPVLVTLEVESRIGLHWGDDGTLVYSQTDGIYRVSAQGGEPERILEGPLLSLRFPRLLPGGGALLFSEMGRLGPEGTGTIRLLDLGTREVTTLVPEGSDARYVESGHLVYGRPSGTLFAVPFDLARREVTGPPFPVLDEIRVIPGFGATAFTASRAGTVAYRIGGTLLPPEARRTFVMVDGAGTRETLPLSPGVVSHPRLSPDGRKLAYVSRNQIHVYDRIVGSNTRITVEGFNQYPVWTPAGDSLVFRSTRAGSNAADLYVAAAAGGGEARVLWSEDGIQIPEAWGADGRLLYTSIRGDGAEDLRILVRTGDPLSVPYLAADWDESRGRISPDGRWAAYESDESGSTEVYVRAFPEPGEKWTVSEGGGRSSRWSRDGRILYYWRADTLVAARVRTDPSFQLLSRSDVLVGSYGTEYDVRPDGTGFVFSEAALAGPGPDENGDDLEPSDDEARDLVVVVVNWFGELRRRAGETGG